MCVTWFVYPNTHMHTHTHTHTHMHTHTRTYIHTHTHSRNVLDHAVLREIGFEVYCIGKPSPESNIRAVKDDSMY
jgi:hypothetical protein